MKVSRRGFLKLAGLISGSCLIPQTGKAFASKTKLVLSEPVGMLVDTTKCIGCRTCEMVCAEVNNLPEPPPQEDDSVFQEKRTTSTSAYTVVNSYETEKGTVYVKRQCMHCNQPACTSACLVKAMLKTKEGPVTWNGDKCMGCRFCMLSCPFDMPKFEYYSANPRIRKCIMCYTRLKGGEQPACSQECPGEALLFGKRRELLEIAHTRIYQNPDDYIHHIYGEHEVGGTGWLYLASVPFTEIGFRDDLGTTAYPELTKNFLYTVPLVLLFWPAFLFGVSRATQGKGETEEL